MLLLTIVAYLILAFALILCDDRKQFLLAGLAVEFSSFMACVGLIGKESIRTMLIYFAVGLVFIFLFWGITQDDIPGGKAKNKFLAAILALPLGTFGVHKYYLGKRSSSLLYILFCWTCIPLILGVLEFLYFLFVSKRTFDFRYNRFASKVGTKETKPAPTQKQAVQKETQDVPQAAAAQNKQNEVPKHVPAPEIVSAQTVRSTQNSSVDPEIEEKYTSVQFVLKDALQKANEIQVFGEKEGNELTAIKEMLKKLNVDFAAEIEKLKNASEWDRFCIAFFGETNAGKSTIIESLRIIYDEETKRAEAMEQKKEYFGLIKQHCEDYQSLIDSLGAVNAALKKNYSKKRMWRNYLIAGSIALVLGLAIGLILANLGIIVW